ncbi:hypothetical protein [Dietzia cinnamea]|uniref:hypothetical protein n=1 Tax=Dietzia cinnamea TaxID=321318 RepID=UPI0021A969FF|nr:hypothetical protein [Dietzia cinnamea]MCT2058403.1 hypothetical protein [Dietzia cinnamea]
MAAAVVDGVFDPDLVAVHARRPARLAQAVGERDDAVRRLARGEVGLDTLTRTPTVIDEMIAARRPGHPGLGGSTVPRWSNSV